VFRVVHQRSQYYFIFGVAHLHWSPDIASRIGGAADFRDWPVKIDDRHRWLDALHRELTSVDPWQVLQDQQNILQVLESSKGNEERFTRKEVKAIQAGPEAVETEFGEFTTQRDEQWSVINIRLDYLKHAADRVAKKDFVLLALGQCVSLAMSRIDPATVKALWISICDAIGPLWGEAHRLLQ
jgi:hypothetical protein